MMEIKGDIFSIPADAIGITTNGIVDRSGRAVMGKGIALAFKNKYPGINLILGEKLKLGNKVHLLISGKPNIFSFPTKNHWKDPSDIELIKKSLLELVELTNSNKWKKVILPRPGCNNGKLDWNEVRKYCELLDDRFYIYTKGD